MRTWSSWKTGLFYPSTHPLFKNNIPTKVATHFTIFLIKYSYFKSSDFSCQETPPVDHDTVPAGLKPSAGPHVCRMSDTTLAEGNAWRWNTLYAPRQFKGKFFFVSFCILCRKQCIWKKHPPQRSGTAMLRSVFSGYSDISSATTILMQWHNLQADCSVSTHYTCK